MRRSGKFASCLGFALALAWAVLACGVPLDEMGSTSTEMLPASSPDAAPLSGKGDGTDAADHACQIVLREVARPSRPQGSFETACTRDGCYFVWIGSVEVATSALHGGATPVVLYHLESDPRAIASKPS